MPAFNPVTSHTRVGRIDSIIIKSFSEVADTEQVSISRLQLDSPECCISSVGSALLALGLVFPVSFVVSGPIILRGRPPCGKRTSES